MNEEQPDLPADTTHLDEQREMAPGHGVARFQAIFAAMSEGLVIHGRDGRVVEANPAAERILGLTRAQLVGKTSTDARWQAIREDGRPYPGAEHPAMVALHTGQPQQDRIMGIDDPLRGRRWLSINAVPIWSADAAQPDAVVATFVDVTERRRQEQQLEQLTAELQDLYDQAPCGYHCLDEQGRFVRVNATELAWLGCTREELIGKKRLVDFLTRPGQEQFAAVFPRFQREGCIRDLEYDLVGADGTVRTVSVSATAVADDQGRFIMSRSVVYDITELHRSREQLRQLAGEQAAMLDNELVGIIKLSGRRILWKNRAMRRIFGYDASELLGQSTRLLFPTDTSFEAAGKAAYPLLLAGGRFRSQVEMVRKDGQRIWIDASGVRLSAHGDESIWFLADITELKRYQEAVESMAHLDALTGLPNRVLLEDRMEQALALARAGNPPCLTAVCHLDLDRFRAVNEAGGHAQGDAVLKALARRLQRAVRPHDTVARWSGDAFVLLLTHAADLSQVEGILREVVAAVRRPMPLEGGRELLMTASIGVALAPQDGASGAELLRWAQTATLVSKQLGRDQVQLYCGASEGGAGAMH